MMFFDRDDKYNWVDENNVVVGFDSYRCCCESFGFFYSRTPMSHENSGDTVDLSDQDLLDYRFDPTFVANDGEDEYSSATFKLVSPNGEIYLTLYNNHNGYYTHGFTLTDNGKVLESGGL